MKRYSEAQILRLGAITLVMMLLVMAAAFNLSKFPGFGGDLYRAEFADASGLARDGHRAAALDKLEALLARRPDHAAGRELALHLAGELGDDARLCGHAAGTFGRLFRPPWPLADT